MLLYASFLRLRLHNGYSFVNGRLCMSQTDEKQGSRINKFGGVCSLRPPSLYGIELILCKD